MTHGPKVFLVLSSASIGGAEKRFAGLWLHLKRRGDTSTTIILPKALRDQLFECPEFAGMGEHASSIVTTADSLALPTGAHFWSLAWLRLRYPAAVFHFTLLPPILAGFVRPTRTVFTVPNSSLTQYSRRGLSVVLSSVAIARRTDVLDDTVCADLRRLVPFRARSLSTTPGSFVDLTYFQPAEHKVNRLTFSGLFSEEKQTDRLVGCLPELAEGLRQAGFRDVEFRLMGRETKRPGVAERCAALNGIDVRAWFEPNPRSVLAGARVFFSLQRTNNYPSKALLEAMACGCIPIVTDVGTTHRIVPPGLGYSVPRDFSARDLLEPAISILRLSDHAFKERVTRLRSFLQERFSIDAMQNYYQTLWQEVAA